MMEVFGDCARMLLGVLLLLLTVAFTICIEYQKEKVLWPHKNIRDIAILYIQGTRVILNSLTKAVVVTSLHHFEVYPEHMYGTVILFIWRNFLPCVLCGPVYAPC